jgi:hypothetical protein
MNFIYFGSIVLISGALKKGLSTIKRLSILGTTVFNSFTQKSYFKLWKSKSLILKIGPLQINHENITQKHNYFTIWRSRWKTLQKRIPDSFEPIKRKYFALWKQKVDKIDLNVFQIN